MRGLGGHDEATTGHWSSVVACHPSQHRHRVLRPTLIQNSEYEKERKREEKRGGQGKRGREGERNDECNNIPSSGKI